MSENDFYTVQGNKFRGSRYSNFAGAGIDAQGNVSSAVNENANNLANSPSQQPGPSTGPGDGTAVAPAISNGGVSQGLLGARGAPPSLKEAGTDLAIGAAAPFVGKTIGSTVGAQVASGAGSSEAIKKGISALGNKVSGGLIGTSGTATNAALSSMGSTYGPATQAAVGKASAGAGIGGAAGTGLGTAAATLLTGGSVKDAALSGIGSAAGFYIGNMILPGVGGFIGSTLGSMVSGLFGGKEQRTSIDARVALDPKTGQYTTGKTTNKNSSNSVAKKYGDNISQILNTFSQATGIKYTDNVGVSGSNIGKKDTGTFYNGKRVSTKAGDSGAVALSFLQQQKDKSYTTGDDAAFNTFWNDALTSSKTITDLGSKVDSYYASRGLMAAPSAPENNVQATATQNAAVYQPTKQDRKLSFYG